MTEGWIYGALFLTGMAAGFIDAIAGGGGLLALPMLLWAGLPPQLALGTNKFQSACGTALAVWRYTRAGLLHWREARLAVIIAALASVAGTLAVTRLERAFLQQLIPWLLLAVGLYALASPDLGRNTRRARLRPISFAIIFGTLLGFYDGFFGPGTGSFWTIAFVLFCGLELRQATAHTKAVNLASNIGSLTVFLIAGKIQFGIGAVMIGGQLIGAYFGAHMVITRGTRFIRVIFLMVVFALILKLLWGQLR
jgi:uncharacterized membrane protein YfcA